jgi:hypothetical protein
MSICNTFDELILNHDVCSILFSEVLTWIKKVLNAYGRHGEPNMLNGDQIQVLPTFPHKATTLLFTQGKKEIKSNTFWKV